MDKFLARRYEAAETGFCRRKRVRVFVSADGVSIFVTGCSDIEVVHKAFERYGKVTATKINRNKTSGLRLADL